MFIIFSCFSSHFLVNFDLFSQMQRSLSHSHFCINRTIYLENLSALYLFFLLLQIFYEERKKVMQMHKQFGSMICDFLCEPHVDFQVKIHPKTFVIHIWFSSRCQLTVSWLNPGDHYIAKLYFSDRWLFADPSVGVYCLAQSQPRIELQRKFHLIGGCVKILLCGKSKQFRSKWCLWCIQCDCYTTPLTS